jgi:acyl-CoA reductase-like NAD-dependent aldehyde dehydrogenase
MLDLPVLGHGDEYRSRSRTTVNDVRGTPVGELSLAPVPYVARTMSSLRAATTLGLNDRLAALAAAGELFATGADDYARTVSQVSGLGITTVRSAIDKITRYCAEAYEHAQYARPAGAVDQLTNPRARTGTAIWARRADVFAVHTAGNHPAVHADWIQALALGYRVAVRPSRREPFTSHRLVSALRAAGFGKDHIALLPSDYDAADEMLRGADRGMVYGGADVVAKYRSNLTVLPQGPGRSKIIVTAETDWRQYVDLIADSVSRGGGTGCTNTTAVFVDGDAAALADAVAERLTALPSLPPEHDGAVLPVQPVEAARRLEKSTLDAAHDAIGVLGADGIVEELDGAAVLRPAVFLLPDAAAPQAQLELPFPCVWIAPWSPATGTAPLQGTLALTALTTNDDLISRLVAEPTIRNLYVGAHPTYWNAPHVPHDGYLADFLMEPKGFIRA